MARYEIQDEAGRVVDSIICPAEQIDAFLEDGQTAVLLSPHDRRDVQEWADLREKRDRLLAESDWTLVPDAPTDKVAWMAYRQALRDLPQMVLDPREPVWPVPPTTD